MTKLTTMVQCWEVGRILGIRTHFTSDIHDRIVLFLPGKGWSWKIRSLTFKFPLYLYLNLTSF